MDLVFENWGLIDYNVALSNQETLVELVQQKQKPPTIIFCTHTPLVTKGRATQAGDITQWEGPIYEINRGGRATYHGPNQLMIYPIIPLQESSSERRSMDVGSFLRQFELALVDMLNDLGIHAHGKSFQIKKTDNKNDSNLFISKATNEETGVWVGKHKVASLGLSIRRWVTFHGAALNVEYDPKAFQGIKPCGFSPSIMTSIEELLGSPPNRNQIINQLQIHLQKRL